MNSPSRFTSSASRVHTFRIPHSASSPSPCLCVSVSLCLCVAVSPCRRFPVSPMRLCSPARLSARVSQLCVPFRILSCLQAFWPSSLLAVRRTMAPSRRRNARVPFQISEVSEQCPPSEDMTKNGGPGELEPSSDGAGRGASPVDRPFVLPDEKVAAATLALFGWQPLLHDNPENLAIIWDQRLQRPLPLACTTHMALERVEDVL